MNAGFKFFVTSMVGISCLPMLTGCLPLLFLGAGGTSMDIATQERGFSGTLNDTDIRAQINHLWFEKSVDLYSNVLLAVQNGYVLLAGSVATEDDRVEAVKLAWQAKGVKEVFNEIKIGSPQSFGNGLEDTWISTKIRSTMLVDEKIHSTNYSVTTFDGVVYLMGVAQSQEELTAAIDIAKDTRGVKNVISHVVLKEKEFPQKVSAGSENQGEKSPEDSPKEERVSQEADQKTIDISAEAYGAPQAPSSEIQEEKLPSPV